MYLHLKSQRSGSQQSASITVYDFGDVIIMTVKAVIDNRNYRLLQIMSVKALLVFLMFTDI